MRQSGLDEGAGPEAMTHQSMAFRWVTDDLVLTFEHGETIDDADWDALLNALALRARTAEGLRLFVYNAHDGPGAAQRARFGQRLRGKPVRIAVLSASPFANALTKAFHQMGFFQVATFAPEKEEAAYRHLSLTAAEIARVREVVGALRSGPKSGPR